MTKLLYALLLILGISSPNYAQSNLLDVVHYDISFDTINFTSKSIEAHAHLEFKSTSAQNITTLEVSLLSLIIDSIIDQNSNALAYSYNDTVLVITLLNPVNNITSETVSIYYHGIPKGDPTGWGGFYFNFNYAFNLGVGFGSDPHVFGRAWFPANDVFTDRSTYSFHVTTATGYKAFCNGILTGVTLHANGNNTWNWNLTTPIPTYLASVAIAPYYTWSRNYQNIPVEIACMPNDSNNVNATFQNLDTVLSHYIQAYGPYPFQKVGYCLIPFNSGAMEHATSIHIGTAYVNGSLTYETLWAHELAHMWWGDWITCESEGDMWLNEGFASFNEAYVTEKLYGTDAYRTWFRTNHRKVLQFAHITDNGYLPLINIPHAHTYGPTVYNKGADVAHTLRYYMQDSLFFQGCRDFMNNRGNSSVNSYHLRDELTTSSGISMNRFFDDWVFTPGFPHFDIDSLEVVNLAAHQYNLHTRQKSKGNSAIYEMKVEVNFTDGVNDTTLLLLMGNMTNSFPVSLNFTPTWYSIDRNDHMGDAISDFEKKLFTTGTNSFFDTYSNVNVITTGADTSTVRAELHWVKPDPFKNASNHPGIRLSDYRYWKFDGIFKPGFLAKATLNYNGSTNATAGHLDNNLITGNEDSLVLFYRSSVKDDWQIVNGYTLTTGNKFDKAGSMTIDTLKRGEYVMGYRDFTTGLSNPSSPNQMDLQIWPNPSSGNVNFKSEGTENQFINLEIFNAEGKNILNTQIKSNQPFIWTPHKGQKGVFVARVQSENKYTFSKIFQVLSF